MQLNELFGDRHDFEVTMNSGFDWKAKAKVGNRTLEVHCELITKRAQNWELFFTMDGEYGLTHDGKEFDVFALVTSMLKKFKEDCKPKQIFMAAYGNRGPLYVRMLKRLLSDWKLEWFKDEDGSTIIAAVDGDEFPVMVYRNTVGVLINNLDQLIGYRIDGHKIYGTDNMRWFILNGAFTKELEKAKEMAEEIVHATE